MTAGEGEGGGRGGVTITRPSPAYASRDYHVTG